jgi:hypothetical protein
VRNENVVHRVKDRNILRTINRRKANWAGHNLHRNCLLKHVIYGKMEGRIQVTGRGGEDVNNYWMTLRKREDTGSTRLHCVESSLWNML